MLDNVRDTDVHGHDVVFFAFVAVALGVVPEQVLQRKWVPLYSIFFRVRFKES